jgi:hypothetical protein
VGSCNGDWVVGRVEMVTCLFETFLRHISHSAVCGHGRELKRDLRVRRLELRRVAQQLVGAGESPQRYGVICGADQQSRCPFAIARGEQMLRGLAGQLWLAVLVEVARCRGVKPYPQSLRQIRVVGVAQERMTEINHAVDDV